MDAVRMDAVRKDAFRAKARAVTRIRAAQLRNLINQVSPSDQHNPNKIVYNIGKFLASKKAGFGVAGSVEARGGSELEDLQPLWWFDPTTVGDEEKRRSFPPPPPTLPPLALREAALGDRPVGEGPPGEAVSYTHLTLPTLYSV